MNKSISIIDKLYDIVKLICYQLIHAKSDLENEFQVEDEFDDEVYQTHLQLEIHFLNQI